MTGDEKSSLFINTAEAISGAQDFIQIRHIRNCYKADPEYGKGVARALGLSMEVVRDYEGYDMSPIAEM